MTQPPQYSATSRYMQVPSDPRVTGYENGFMGNGLCPVYSMGGLYPTTSQAPCQCPRTVCPSSVNTGELNTYIDQDDSERDKQNKLAAQFAMARILNHYRLPISDKGVKEFRDKHYIIYLQKQKGVDGHNFALELSKKEPRMYKNRWGDSERNHIRKYLQEYYDHQRKTESLHQVKLPSQNTDRKPEENPDFQTSSYHHLTHKLLAGYHVQSIEKQKDIILGQGGHGIIYSMKGNLDLCIKESNKQKVDVTRQWRNEFDTIKTMIKKITQNNLCETLSTKDYVRICTPVQFIETTAQCYMLIPRIFRPDNIKSNITIQTCLGTDSDDRIIEGRGQIVGLEQVKEYFSEKDLTEAVRDIGSVIAAIQYIAKNDAYDIELVIGHEHSDELNADGVIKNRFYIIDFDLTSIYEEPNFKRLADILEFVPYFPTRSETNKEMQHLFETFRDGYQLIAGQEFTDKVFEYYDLYYP